MVAHFGLTVEKGVIMLEFINELRQEGHPIQEALFLAGKTRMRPVLMTAITSIVGVVPLAIGMGAGSEIQQPYGDRPHWRSYYFNIYHPCRPSRRI